MLISKVENIVQMLRPADEDSVQRRPPLPVSELERLLRRKDELEQMLPYARKNA